MSDDAPATRVKSARLKAVLAICQGCEWSSDAANALPNGARHHDATGHIVDVELVTAVRYGDPDVALAASGQTSFDDTLDHADRGGP